MECIESVNVHEDIKLGLPTRDKFIENYKISIKIFPRLVLNVSVIILCRFLTGHEQIFLYASSRWFNLPLL